MAVSNTDRALEAMKKCEEAGKLVKRIIVEGKRMEIEFSDREKVTGTELDHIKW